MTENNYGLSDLNIFKRVFRARLQPIGYSYTRMGEITFSGVKTIMSTTEKVYSDKLKELLEES